MPGGERSLKQAAKGIQVPAQVVRQPSPETKPRFYRYPIGPRRRHLCDTSAAHERLDHDLHPDLEAAAALQAERAQERGPVHLEAVRDVVRGKSGEEVERFAGCARKEVLQPRTADLTSARHVA